jgi:oligopeptide/dipeptide ABC transporter ATP-binding protein
MRVGTAVGEPLAIHKLAPSRAARRERVADLFRRVGLDPAMMDRYPHEFSGGQRQRIGIARAIACGPEFIVADEPVSALDAPVQAQIVNLLIELQEALGLAYLFIAHDLRLVREICDRVAVMYLGRIVEEAPVAELFERPQHPYTRALLASTPEPRPGRPTPPALRGEPASAARRPSGCAFHPRCPVALPVCSRLDPLLLPGGGSHRAACHLVHPPAEVVRDAGGETDRRTTA